MKSFSYYTFDEKGPRNFNVNSRERTDAPLAVNCAGFVSMDSAFVTYNAKGRLDYYLMYILDGKLRGRIDGASFTARPGDFIIYPPKYKYRYSSSGEPLSYYFVHFSGTDAAALLDTIGFSPLPLVRTAGSTAELTDAFAALFSAYSEEKYRDVGTAVALGRILFAIAKSDKDKTSRLERSRSYIKTFYAEDIRVPRLADMEGLSVSRYNAIFRETYGTSPIKYITSLRIMHACSLLISTDLSVKEIGCAVGYEDNCFFSKIFRANTGTSPQKYREKNRA